MTSYYYYSLGAVYGAVKLEFCTKMKVNIYLHPCTNISRKYYQTLQARKEIRRILTRAFFPYYSPILHNKWVCSPCLYTYRTSSPQSNKEAEIPECLGGWGLTIATSGITREAVISPPTIRWETLLQHIRMGSKHRKNSNVFIVF